MDGKQRLASALKFLKGELPAFGLLIHEYEDRLKGMKPDFIFNVNNLRTREEVLSWYIEMNAGAIAHTEEELNRVRRLLDEERERDKIK